MFSEENSLTSEKGQQFKKTSYLCKYMLWGVYFCVIAEKNSVMYNIIISIGLTLLALETCRKNMVNGFPALSISANTMIDLDYD